MTKEEAEARIVQLSAQTQALTLELSTQNGIARSENPRDKHLWVDQRWVSIGMTQLQLGLMSLRRAVGKEPEF